MPHFLKSLFSPFFLHDLGVLRECITLRSWLSPVWVCVCVHMYTYLDVMYLYSCTIHTYIRYMCVCAQYIICAHACIPKCIHMHPYVCLLHFLNPNNSSFLPHRKSHFYEKLKNKFFFQPSWIRYIIYRYLIFCTTLTIHRNIFQMPTGSWAIKVTQ